MNGMRASSTPRKVPAGEAGVSGIVNRGPASAFPPMDLPRRTIPGHGHAGETGRDVIEVERLTRQYGSVKALEGITFEVGRGEIVGLLGPNGAGKTTTMRILTTFLAPTSGRAGLAGHDVLDEPLEVRRR